MMKKITILGLCIFILMILTVNAKVVTINNCPILETTNATGLSPGGNRDAAVYGGYNFSGNWTAWNLNQVLNTIDADKYIFNTTGRRWEDVAVSNLSIPIPGADFSNQQSLDVKFNITGNSTTNLLWTTANHRVYILYWAGTTWLEENSTSRFQGNTSTWNNPIVIGLKNFPQSTNTTIMIIAGSNQQYMFYTLNGTKWDNSSSPHAGLGTAEVDSKADIVYNLTGNNTWIMVTAPAGTGLVNYYEFNGTGWDNITTSNRYLSQFTTSSNTQFQFVYNFTTSAGNWTLFNLSTGAHNLVSGFGAYGGLEAIRNSTNVTQSFVGEPINFSAYARSRCGILNASFAHNATGPFVNFSNTEYLSANQSLNASANLTLPSFCSKTIGLKAYLTTFLGNTTEIISSTIFLLPQIYNSTANSSVLLGITCASARNATVTTNATAIVDFTLNMSAIFFGFNQTCPYGADNVARLENRNQTTGCSVLVFGANMSTTQNITIDESEAISGRGVGNIPAALGAAAIATLIVVYTITRTRRQD